ncbi:hypothetical protein CERZMDRAFT_88673 [Cercospora zeae-maydis SCOH1-5]|uniref:Uncharacterized protein n=1 Tax=Cercospora zeae-maydis SCOH1-5 TaxID=717836 RepID=A0A6A6F1X9_9PEZI|nr:hypothetical protein CERZMDRAFT_88673 [Cercospora zeae-maydis SCOH1-5]
MASTLEEQKATVCAAVRAQMDVPLRPALRSERDFWVIISDSLRQRDIYKSAYLCRRLFKSCHKDKTRQDPLPDVRRYMSNAVRRWKRVTRATNERARLAQSECEGDEEEGRAEEEAVSREIEESGAAKDGDEDEEMDEGSERERGEDVDGNELPAQFTLPERLK